jgi:hypothetical protein
VRRRAARLATPKREKSESHGFWNHAHGLGAIVGIGAAIVVALPGMASAQAANMGAAELLPPNAKPGECYARGFVAAAYKIETAQVITREASDRVEIIPARYAVGRGQVRC